MPRHLHCGSNLASFSSCLRTKHRRFAATWPCSGRYEPSWSPEASGESIRNDMKYDYGDSVTVNNNAPEHYRPKAKGSLCGVRRVETDEQAKAANTSVGATLWLVEFADGSSVEVLEEYLIPLDS